MQKLRTTSILTVILVVIMVLSSLVVLYYVLPGKPMSGQTGLIEPVVQGENDYKFVNPAPVPEHNGLNYINSVTDTLCLMVTDQTFTSTFTITNPDEVSGFDDLNLANFSQRIINKTATSLEIQVISRSVLDTHASYPLNPGSLPADVRPYLEPEKGEIQSDHPQIVSKARELAANATTEAEVVDAIVAWVRGNITYQLDLPVDAVSVFNNRAGQCAGFSTLTAALLRAAGIPATYHEGCVSKWGWQVGDEGGWHAWNLVYYPDMGWVGLDPQTTSNYLDTSHIIYGFSQCGENGTIISRTSHEETSNPISYLRTPYTQSSWGTLYSAWVPSWDRHPLKLTPPYLSAMLPTSNPVTTTSIKVEDFSCNGEDWQIITECAWLTPSEINSDTAGTATFTLNASGMGPGVYTCTLTAYTTVNPYVLYRDPKVIEANLVLLDQVFTTFVPLASKRN